MKLGGRLGDSGCVRVQAKRGRIPGVSSALDIYLREIRQTDLLTEPEEATLARRAQAGDQGARERLIRAHLRLVARIARAYESLGLPLLDLIRGGNIGLMKAAERFDPEQGVRLSTYSHPWINQYIRRALATRLKTIRLPVSPLDELGRLRQPSAKPQRMLGRKSSNGELARKTALSVHRTNESRRANIPPVSLDAPLRDGHARTRVEEVAHEQAPNPGRLLEERASADQLKSLILRRSDRLSCVIRPRFDLNRGREETLEKAGRKCCLTSE